MTQTDTDVTTKKALIAFIIGYILISIGFVLSFHFNDPLLLSRSGCLVVCLGIYITWTDFRSKIRSDLNSMMIYYDKKKDEIDSYYTKEQIKDNIQGTSKSRKEFAKIWYESNEGLIAFLEISLLVSGTFFWGFGDLIISWLH